MCFVGMSAGMDKFSADAGFRGHGQVRPVHRAGALKWGVDIRGHGQVGCVHRAGTCEMGRRHPRALAMRACASCGRAKNGARASLDMGKLGACIARAH